MGYSLALFMGLTLGLIGAGGSILTMPILVYCLNIKPITATAYSLLVVGMTALFGSIRYQRMGHVRIKEALSFAIPSMSAAFITRAIIVPTLPVMIIGVSKDNFIMLLFSLLMITASGMLLKNGIKDTPIKESYKYPFLYIITGSICVGLLTGLVGAGGGFLIIPSLIYLFAMPMKDAIGTSLVIIAMNSLIGINGDFHTGLSINWSLVGIFLIMTLLGVSLGSKMSEYIDGGKLKKLFALFTLTLGVAILFHQLLEIL